MFSLTCISLTLLIDFFFVKIEDDLNVLSKETHQKFFLLIHIALIYATVLEKWYLSISVSCILGKLFLG